MRHPPSLSALPLALLLALLAALPPAGCGRSAPPTIALSRAVQLGNLEQIRRHIDYRSDLDQTDANGDAPLHVAVRAGQVAIVRELVDHGASLVTVDGRGRRPLDLALIQGKTQVATLLVEQGAPFDPQATLVALVRAGVSDRDSFAFLTRRGADLNRPDGAGDTPLHQAVALGHLETVKRLISRGADVNRPDGKGRTPLALAQGLDPKAPSADDIRQALQQSGARP
jgi:uncharacterized protein